MDLNLYLFKKINGLSGKNRWLDAFGRAGAEFVVLAMAGWFVALAWFTYAPDYQKFFTVLGASLAAALAGWGINFLCAFLVHEPRPYLVLENVNAMFHPYIPSLHRWKSFPSDHSFWALIIFLLALIWQLPLSWPLLPLALWVGWGRVYAGVHYPGDVAGGFAVAFFIASVMNYLINIF